MNVWRFLVGLAIGALLSLGYLIVSEMDYREQSRTPKTSCPNPRTDQILHVTVIKLKDGAVLQCAYSGIALQYIIQEGKR